MTAGSTTKASSLRPDGRPPLRVLILTMEYGPELSGGVGTHARELATGLASAGHDVRVLTYAHEEAGEVQVGRVRLTGVVPTATFPLGSAQHSLVRGVLDFGKDLLATATTLLTTTGWRPDVIHFYNWLTRWPAAELGRRFDIPTIGRISYLSEPCERWWGQVPDPEIVRQEREAYEAEGPFIAVSRSVAELVSAVHGVPADRFTVIHNGLDLSGDRRSTLDPEARRRLRDTVAGDGEEIVLFVGRLNPQKGIAALFAAAERVAAERSRVRFVVAGEPDSRDFRREVAALRSRFPRAAAQMIFLGRVPHRRVGWLYQVADLTVMPSIYEPFGWVAIEAMAAGCALVATDQGGPAEIVADGETGLLVPLVAAADDRREVDVEALAAAQLRLLGDEEERRSFGEAGRRRVTSHFRRDTMVASTVSAYAEARAGWGAAMSAAPRAF